MNDESPGREREPIAATPPTTAVVAFNREDFAVLAHTFKRRRRGVADVVLGASFVLILVVGAELGSAAAERGLSTGLQVVAFFLMWALAAIPLILGFRRTRRLLRTLGLRCPSCDSPLVDVLRPAGREEFVTGTGTCPGCGHRLFPT